MCELGWGFLAFNPCKLITNLNCFVFVQNKPLDLFVCVLWIQKDYCDRCKIFYLTFQGVFNIRYRFGFTLKNKYVNNLHRELH